MIDMRHEKQHLFNFLLVNDVKYLRNFDDMVKNSRLNPPRCRNGTKYDFYENLYW